MTQAVAQSWLVLQATHSAFLLSLIATATFAPLLAGGAYAGSVVDRFDRRLVLVFTQSSYFVLGSALGGLALAGTLPVGGLFAFAFVNGLVSAFDMPARQVLVVELVGPTRTANAISLNEVVINSSRVLGPAAGAVLLATLGAAACFLFNAASYLPPLAVVLVILHRRGALGLLAARPGRLGGPGAGGPRRGRGQGPRAKATNGGVREGLAFAWQHRAVRYALAMAVAAGMLYNMGSTLPLVAARVFHLGAGAYGAMVSAFGGGAVAGALVAGRGPSWPSARRVRALGALTGATVCLDALSPAVAGFFAGLAVAGFLSIWFIALANALVQLRTGPALRGRVMGLWSMALPGTTPLTSLLVGGVATWAGGSSGARAGFGLSGAALLVTVALGWRSLGDS